MLTQYKQAYERHTSALHASSSGHRGGAAAPAEPPAPMDRADALRLAKWLAAEGVLGRSRNVLLRWLSEAGDRSRAEGPAAGVRARATKWLAAAVEADVRLLGLPEVAAGVHAALNDEASSVREAAVDLLGRYVSSSTELALAYFDTLANKTQDGAVSVRKRAVRILWDVCLRCERFPRAVDAAVCVLHRCADPEDSMRHLVTKMCSQLWFAAGSGPGAASWPPLQLLLFDDHVWYDRRLATSSHAVPPFPARCMRLV